MGSVGRFCRSAGFSPRFASTLTIRQDWPRIRCKEASASGYIKEGKRTGDQPSGPGKGSGNRPRPPPPAPRRGRETDRRHTCPSHPLAQPARTTALPAVAARAPDAFRDTGVDVGEYTHDVGDQCGPCRVSRSQTSTAHVLRSFMGLLMDDMDHQAASLSERRRNRAGPSTPWIDDKVVARARRLDVRWRPRDL